MREREHWDGLKAATGREGAQNVLGTTPRMHLSIVTVEGKVAGEGSSPAIHAEFISQRLRTHLPA